MTQTLPPRLLPLVVLLSAPLTLVACETTPTVAPRAASVACVVLEPQPFYWPDRCEAAPGATDECRILQDIARIAVENNAARDAICRTE